MARKAAHSTRRTGVSSAQVRALMDAAIGHYQDLDEEETEVEATNEAPPAASSAAWSSKDALRRSALAAQPERAQALRARRARISVSVLREVREAVVGQIALVPFVSMSSDQTMCSILYRFAEYICALEGNFNPDEHLSDRWIQHYLHDRRNELTTSSQATIQSNLRRMRAGSPDKPRPQQRKRKVAQEPYSAKEWGTLRRRVRELVDEGLKTDLTMLLDLAGEVGLRPSELISATGRWVESVNGVTVVRVPDVNGEFRDAPAFGLVADRLAAHRLSHNYLFAPQISDRRNALTRIKQRAAAQSGLQDVNAMRARNHWLAELVTRDVPSTVVWAVAGLKPGTHTIGDILPHAPHPGSADIVRHLSRIRDNY